MAVKSAIELAGGQVDEEQNKARTSTLRDMDTINDSSDHTPVSAGRQQRRQAPPRPEPHPRRLSQVNDTDESSTLADDELEI